MKTWEKSRQPLKHYIEARCKELVCEIFSHFKKSENGYLILV